MDAGYIYAVVCVDAGRVGAVLDGVKSVWYCPDADNKTRIKIKSGALPRFFFALYFLYVFKQCVWGLNSGALYADYALGKINTGYTAHIIRLWRRVWNTYEFPAVSAQCVHIAHVQCQSRDFVTGHKLIHNKWFLGPRRSNNWRAMPKVPT